MFFNYLFSHHLQIKHKNTKEKNKNIERNINIFIQGRNLVKNVLTRLKEIRLTSKCKFWA